MAKIPLLECLTRHSYRECLGRVDSLPEHEGSEKAEMKTSTELVLSPDTPRTTNKSLLTSFHKSVEHVAPDTTDVEIGETCQSTAQQDETSVDAKDRDLPFFNVSLLDWINVQDRPNDVESLVRKCFDSMSRVSNVNLIFLIIYTKYFIKWENGYCVKIEIMSFGVKENFVFYRFYLH